MPSKRRQLNIRLSSEGEARLEALATRMQACLGMEISKADVIHAGLLELEKRYPPGPEELRVDSSARNPRGRPRKEPEQVADSPPPNESAPEARKSHRRKKED